MGFRGNNSRTFAEYVELEIAIDEHSPNAYLFKRRDSETNKPVSERSWYVGIPIPNKGNGKRYPLVPMIFLWQGKKHNKQCLILWQISN